MTGTAIDLTERSKKLLNKNEMKEEQRHSLDELLLESQSTMQRSKPSVAPWPFQEA